MGGPKPSCPIKADKWQKWGEMENVFRRIPEAFSKRLSLVFYTQCFGVGGFCPRLSEESVLVQNQIRFTIYRSFTLTAVGRVAAALSHPLRESFEHPND